MDALRFLLNKREDVRTFVKVGVRDWRGGIMRVEAISSRGGDIGDAKVKVLCGIDAFACRYGYGDELGGRCLYLYKRLEPPAGCKIGSRREICSSLTMVTAS